MALTAKFVAQAPIIVTFARAGLNCHHKVAHVTVWMESIRLRQDVKIVTNLVPHVQAQIDAPRALLVSNLLKRFA